MFQSDPDDLDMHVIYDVSHNIAKVEEHFVNGKPKTLLVRLNCYILDQISSPAGLVLEFEMWRHFDAKQKSKLFTLCHCV